jgi:hypothetical protein
MVLMRRHPHMNLSRREKEYEKMDLYGNIVGQLVIRLKTQLK